SLPARAAPPPARGAAACAVACAAARPRRPRTCRRTALRAACRSAVGRRRAWSRSRGEGQEHRHPEGGGEVVDDAGLAEQLLLEDLVADVDPDREPLVEEELDPEA